MSASPVIGIDHVQLLCPTGGEEAARRYWRDLVHLPEVEKPKLLRGRGGVWFRCGDHGLHIGADADFAPATRAHPAIRVRDATAYDALAVRLADAGYKVVHADPPIAERRMKTLDPFGNMVEFVLGSTG